MATRLGDLSIAESLLRGEDFRALDLDEIIGGTRNACCEVSLLVLARRHTVYANRNRRKVDAVAPAVEHAFDAHLAGLHIVSADERMVGMRAQRRRRNDEEESNYAQTKTKKRPNDRDALSQNMPKIGLSPDP